MRIIFAGTPEIAAAVLEALVTNQYNIVGILTQPDRPQGRGLKLTPSPVKVLAQKHNIRTFTPKSLKTDEIQEDLKKLKADLMIVLAYGLILPQAVLDIPKKGCINIHASILPRYRGAAPIQYAILNGDPETGITIMQMDAGMDTGDILETYRCKIEGNYTSGELLNVLTDLAQIAILDSLKKLQANTLTPIAQDNHLATYAPKIEKAEAKINWQTSALQIERNIRAYNPWPVAFTQFCSEILRVWGAQYVSEMIVPDSITPGTVLNIDSNGLLVATGDGVLRLTTLQLPGKKQQRALDVCNAHPQITVGAKFN